MGTRVLGYSSTEEWYERANFESLLSHPERWESAANKQQSIESWADPDDDAWTLPVFSPTSEPITRVIIQVGYLTQGATPERVATMVKATIENCRARFPELSKVVLEAPNGGPNEQVCWRYGKKVYACLIRPTVLEANNLVLNSPPKGVIVTWGLQPNVGSCSWFRDGTGHFTETGANGIAAKYAAFYG